MITVKSKQKPGKNEGLIGPINLSRIVMVALIIVGLYLVWVVIRNDSYYWTNPSSARATVEDLIGQVNSDDKQVYSNIADLGCDRGSSVGLATVVDCDFVGHKYFLGEDDLSSDLHSIDAILTAHGWERSLSTGQTLDQFEQGLSGSVQGLLYRHGKGNVATIVHYKDTNADILKMVTGKSIAAPGPGEYIYGVRVAATYWSCRDQSMPRLPCVVPPWYKEAK